MKKKGEENSESQWQNWAADGRLATGGWFVVFCAYIGFRLAKIDAPELTNAFVTVTGIWVGNLGVAQSKKVTKMERNVEKLTKRREEDDARDALESGDHNGA